MKISACFITKGDSEIKSLQNSINSVLPHIDSLHITANGKETAEIEALMRSLEEKYPDKLIDYSYLAWNNDFSEQRNFNFDRVPKDSDFIFWMDSDDILIGGEYLRDVASIAKETNKDCVFFTYWYGCTFKGEPTLSNLITVDIEHQRERLMKPGYFAWKGRLHETPVTKGEARNAYVKYAYDPKDRPIAIMHTANKEDAQEKMNRNRTLLELQLEDEKKVGQADPRTLLYLMKIYTESSNTSLLLKCINFGREYLQKSGWDEERAVCNDLMARCYMSLGDSKEAEKLLIDAIKEYPHSVVFYVRLALVYYQQSKFRASKHWFNLAGTMEIDDKSAGIVNMEELKVLFTQLKLKLSYNVDKNTKEALEAAKSLYVIQPIKENKENVEFLQNLDELNDTCRDTHKLIKYLEKIEETNRIVPLLESLPEAINKQPFAISYFKKYIPARVWGDKEICYFANFGQAHFEQWDSTSLEKGIGGSETAVIKLAEEWTKKGYRVTVYGDPINKGEQNGVLYLPWYYFNMKDSFNIFIQWRGSFMADKINAKKLFIDLHDVYFSKDIKHENVDKIMVKSKYHKELGQGIPMDKLKVVGNGI